MDIYTILIETHIGFAIVLFSLAIISVSIAVLSAVNPGADQANKKLVARANKVGFIENIFVALVTLTGVIAIYLGSFSFSELWLWMSLMIMVFYSLMLVLVTKPARSVVATNGSTIKAGMQVLFHVAHILLLILAVAFMLIRPI